jgi:hypothetical protein
MRTTAEAMPAGSVSQRRHPKAKNDEGGYLQASQPMDAEQHHPGDGSELDRDSWVRP